MQSLQSSNFWENLRLRNSIDPAVGILATTKREWRSKRWNRTWLIDPVRMLGAESLGKLGEFGGDWYHGKWYWKDQPTNSLEVSDLHDKCFSGYVLLPVYNIIFVSEIKMMYRFSTFHDSSFFILNINHHWKSLVRLPGFHHAQQVDLDDGNDEATFESSDLESDGVFHHLNANRDLCWKKGFHSC